MTKTNDHIASWDDKLVAYLDGELTPSESVAVSQRIAADPDVAARLNTLVRGNRPFREAFDPLLAEAPETDLEAMLAGLLAREMPVARARLLRTRLAAIAAGLALLAVGAGLDRAAMGGLGSAMTAATMASDGSADWRQAVAQYQTLYSSDTLASLPDDDVLKAQELSALQARVGVKLTPARVSLPDLDFKRAETFQYDGQALGHLAYLDPQSGPIALCIITGQPGEAAPQVERRHGMNIVYWSHHDHGFLLIGHATPQRLQALAAIVEGRFGGEPGKTAIDPG